jgi:hypothetical protein
MKGETEASFINGTPYSTVGFDPGSKGRLIHEGLTLEGQVRSVTHLGQKKGFSAPLVHSFLPVFPRGGCGGSGEIPFSGAEVIHRQGLDNDPKQYAVIYVVFYLINLIHMTNP